MESSGRTLVCSVLFLDIVEYSKKPVAEQLHLKQAFNASLGRALEEVAPRDRIILDTGDGAAITFLGDPEDALFASISMRDAAAALGVRAGVNLGPVRLVKDLNGQVNIIGDGINVAQRVMSFARAGQLLVSRSFYEVVSCLSRDYASLFRHEGSRTDKHVRDHEVYSVGGTPSARRLADTHPAPGGRIVNLRYWMRGIGPLGLRRSALVAAPLVLLFIIAGGVAARAMFEMPAPAPAPQAAAKSAVVPAPKPVVEDKPVATGEKPVPAADKPVPNKQVVASADKKPEKPKAAKPATSGSGKVELFVSPWGEVVVDGKSRGISPPLKVVELTPGTHTVEIRNSTFPAHVQKVQVRAGRAVQIRHRFK